MRPAKRHRRAGRGTAFHSRARQILAIPYLFSEHATLVGKILHCLEERFWVPAGGEFVVAAFACQNRPATAYARSVECAAIILLAVAIVIVTTPSRPLRQIVFEHAIDNLDRVAHERIVRTANAESHQVKEIAADDISRRV